MHKFLNLIYKSHILTRTYTRFWEHWVVLTHSKSQDKYWHSRYFWFDITSTKNLLGQKVFFFHILRYIYLCYYLFGLEIANTFDSSTSSKSGWGCWVVSGTSESLAAFHAGPDANNGALDRFLTAEWAWVLLALWNFNLLDSLTEGGTITDGIFTANTDFLGSASHRIKG